MAQAVPEVHKIKVKDINTHRKDTKITHGDKVVNPNIGYVLDQGH